MKVSVILLLSLIVLVQGKRNPFRKYIQKKTAVQKDAEIDSARLLNSNLRCHGQNNGCCTSNNPCDYGDGDCDYDSHCARDLVCGSNNCQHLGGDPDDDCCTYRQVEQKQALCQFGRWVGGDGYGGSEEWLGYETSERRCYEKCLARRKSDKSINGCTMRQLSYYPKGGCYVEHNMYRVATNKAHRFKTCYLPYIDASSLRCQGADNGCCTKQNPCGLHDGDCDNNDECMPGLYCGRNNCAWGKKDDCCMERHAGDEKEKEEMEKIASEDPKFEEYREDAANVITVEYK